MNTEQVKMNMVEEKHQKYEYLPAIAQLFPGKMLSSRNNMDYSCGIFIWTGDHLESSCSAESCF